MAFTAWSSTSSHPSTSLPSASGSSLGAVAVNSGAGPSVRFAPLPSIHRPHADDDDVGFEGGGRHDGWTQDATRSGRMTSSISNGMGMGMGLGRKRGRRRSPVHRPPELQGETRDDQRDGWSASPEPEGISDEEDLDDDEVEESGGALHSAYGWHHQNQTTIKGLGLGSWHPRSEGASNDRQSPRSLDVKAPPRKRPHLDPAVMELSRISIGQNKVHNGGSTDASCSFPHAIGTSEGEMKVNRPPKFSFLSTTSFNSGLSDHLQNVTPRAPPSSPTKIPQGRPLEEYDFWKGRDGEMGLKGTDWDEEVVERGQTLREASAVEPMASFNSSSAVAHPFSYVPTPTASKSMEDVCSSNVGGRKDSEPHGSQPVVVLRSDDVDMMEHESEGGNGRGRRYRRGPSSYDVDEHRTFVTSLEESGSDGEGQNEDGDGKEEEEVIGAFQRGRSKGRDGLDNDKTAVGGGADHTINASLLEKLEAHRRSLLICSHHAQNQSHGSGTGRVGESTRNRRSLGGWTSGGGGLSGNSGHGGRRRRGRMSLTNSSSPSSSISSSPCDSPFNISRAPSPKLVEGTTRNKGGELILWKKPQDLPGFGGVGGGGASQSCNTAADGERDNALSTSSRAPFVSPTGTTYSARAQHPTDKELQLQPQPRFAQPKTQPHPGAFQHVASDFGFGGLSMPVLGTSSSCSSTALPHPSNWMHMAAPVAGAEALGDAGYTHQQELEMQMQMRTEVEGGMELDD